jgi:hypothetical protein
MGAKPKSWWHQLDDAIDESDLPASDRAVFHRRVKRSDYSTGKLASGYVESQPEVARKTGLTRRQVQRAERHLELHGWLKFRGTTGPGKRRSITLAIGSDCDCTGRVHERPRVARTGDTIGTRTGDTNGRHVAGQRPVPAEGLSSKRVNFQKPQDQLRSGDRVECPFCGADGVVGERLIEHKPDCWRGGMLALYDREPGS